MKKANNKKKNEHGVSMIETLAVFGVVAILTMIALPQMATQRRLMRSAGLNREIMVALRLTRQLSLSQAGATPTGPLQRVAYTFQYNDTTKQVRIIGPIPSGTVALVDANYPNNTGSSVVATISLTQGGLSVNEIMYGIPAGTELPDGAPIVPTTALDDGVSKSDLTSNKLNITFQPDGSVIDPGGDFQNRALFLYNKYSAQGTASAISVLGASGRAKIWRYGSYANAYAE